MSIGFAKEGWSIKLGLAQNIKQMNGLDARVPDYITNRCIKLTASSSSSNIPFSSATQQESKIDPHSLPTNRLPLA